MKKNTIKISACHTCNGNCFGCFYTDMCPYYMDIHPYTPAEITVSAVKKYALCEGRHEIPQAKDGAIFPSIVKPVVDELEAYADKFVYNHFLQGQTMHLYTTGLTMALLAVLNACKKHSIHVVVFHYNRDTGDYDPQEIK